LLFLGPMRTKILFSAILGLAACGSDTSDPGADGNTQTARATWYQDVGPIMATHCMSCHQAGGIAPFALTDYDSAKENAMRALDKVDKGEMPPFDAREEADCTPRFNWKDDQRLSAAEKTKIHQWVEDGFALGPQATLPTPPSTDLPNKSITLAPSTPFAAQGSRDQFMCFILDPHLAVGQWMTGLQVRPGNDKVVHHVVLTELEPNADTQALVNAHGIGTAFDCDQMNQPGFVINIWTPGNNPMQTPTDLAVPMVANAKVLMQIHYHPAGAVNDPDTTSVDMRFSQQWPKKMYFITAFGNEFAAPNLLPDPDDTGTPQFMIPKNKADHVEHMRRTVPALGGLTGVTVYSANPHMHLVGTHIAGKIERPAARGSDPQNECLANGGWNFDWQRTYIYDTPLTSLPTIQQGDVIDVTCHWNNTIENPFVQRMLNDSHLPPTPVDISLGEQTTNEMCLEIFGLAVDAPPPPAPPAGPGLPASFRLPSGLDTLPQLR
jgi:hypothetical protein